ncbi:hypothetical protein [Streptomyces sp. NPDC051183]|uniref:hypothetical protein n=1 Tax=Streptomyces sp. NPDC051183 TaxID=3155165 RepID=UPI00343548F4
MRIRLSLVLVLVAAALVTGCGEKASPSGWQPDDALQRADEALEKDDVAPTVKVRGTGFLAGGLDKTLETAGESPFRFDITCDSEESSQVKLTISREGDPRSRSVDVSCAGEVTRLNVPAGEPLVVHVEPAAKEGSAPAGVIAWQLGTIAPKGVKGCADDVKGC